MTDFEQLYITWYSRAKGFARVYLPTENDAENIVQDTFLSLYERQDAQAVYTNPIAYLFTALKNRSMDLLRKRALERAASEAMQNDFYIDMRMRLDSLNALNVNFLDEDDIEYRLNKALDALPERCRQIFVMNKIEGKRQRQIAQELGISVNTVESQMAIAYRKLREELKDCMPLLLFLFAFN